MLPIKRYFMICVGMIGISPQDFGIFVIEVNLAIDGFREFHTVEEVSQ